MFDCGSVTDVDVEDVGDKAVIDDGDSEGYRSARISNACKV